MNIMESVILAVDSVRSNKLRSILTLISVTIGVFAIIGAGTLTTSIESAVSTEMSSLGETNFTISRTPAVMQHGDWRKYMKRKAITYKQAAELKEELESNKYIEFVSSSCSGDATVVKYKSKSTDPDVYVQGGDDNYLASSARTIESGREIGIEDVKLSRNIALIGNDVAVKIFDGTSPLGKSITVGNQKYDVVGIFKAKGAVMGQSQDNLVVVPITNYLKYFSSEWEQSMDISVRAKDKKVLDDAINEAIGKFRIVRNIKPWAENDFEITTNEALSESFSGLTGFLKYFGLICGIVSLGAAGVGIMNIMLVSVKERTREIGVRKAIGAKKTWIILQFIIETITICQIGGFVGIVLGVGGAWALSLALEMPLVFPIDQIIFAVIICTVLGVISGAYPAWKAAKLDPIEALRYE
ncbi:MAG: ABC transporter permease [Candidatus Kapabacteria bacterium]|nr:ABC transporter permease [Candidatus Kapabacteria bacterium]